jgi:hypothetical protein
MMRIRYKTLVTIRTAKNDNWQFGFVDTKNEANEQVILNYMDSLEEGVDVWVVDSEGVEQQPEDGVYSGSGKKITVKGGKIEKIETIEGEPQVEFATETDTEKDTEKEDKKDSEEYVTKKDFQDFVNYVDEILGVINEKLSAFSADVNKFNDKLNEALKFSDAKFVEPTKVIEKKTQLFG